MRCVSSPRPLLGEPVSLLDAVRSAAKRVTERARFVRIEPEALGRLADELAAEAAAPAQLDPAHHRLADEPETIAYIVTLDAINFGSGWFPVLRKRPGCSGYFTIATALKERFERDGEITAAELAGIELPQLAATLDQDASHPEVRELLEHFEPADMCSATGTAAAERQSNPGANARFLF